MRAVVFGRIIRHSDPQVGFMSNGTPKPFAPWLMLISRVTLFAIMQLLIAALLWLSGEPEPLRESARWWLFSVILTNLVSIALLIRLFKAEGKRFFDLIRFQPETLWKDIGLSVAGFLLAGPIAFLPMNAAAEYFLGSSEAATTMMFQPIPVWALVFGILFPLTIALAELPTYFGYVMPRLEKQLGSGWLAWGIAAAFLSIQHCTLPLILDSGFLMYRLVMFLPLALYLGLILKLRPRLLPYLVIGHALLDFGTLAAYLM